MVAPFALEPKGTVRARMIPIANELISRGHEVEIIVPPWDNQSYSGQQIEFDGVPVNHVIAGPDKISEHLQITWRLFKTTRQLNPDLVHVFKPKGHSGITAILLSFFERVPVVLDTDDWEGNGGHNTRTNRPPFVRTFFHYQERITPKLVDAVTVASRTLQTQIWGEGIPPENVFYAPNGQSADQFDVESGDGKRVRRNLGITTEPIVLLYTRFFEYNMERMVEVFNRTVNRIPDAQFVVIGRGKNGEEETFEELIKEYDLEDQTYILGWVEFENLVHYFDATDIAVYPFDDTLINRAKCPAKLTELMLTGCPIAAEEVGQIREYIAHGESGLLCQPGDKEVFTDNIVSLLTSNDLRLKLGENARKRILTKFAWSRITDAVEESYTVAVQ